MKQIRIWFISVALAPLIGSAMGASAASIGSAISATGSSSESLAVKGLSIGMDFSQGCSLLSEKLGAESRIRTPSGREIQAAQVYGLAATGDVAATYAAKLEYPISKVCDLNQSFLVSDSGNKVTAIRFSPADTNSLFNVPDLSGEKFVDAYDIDGMEWGWVFEATPGWTYGGRDGFSIKISHEKEVLIYATRVVDKRAFD